MDDFFIDDDDDDDNSRRKQLTTVIFKSAFIENSHDSLQTQVYTGSQCVYNTHINIPKHFYLRNKAVHTRLNPLVYLLQII